MKATAILPVKRFAAAKRRLATGIDDERRQALVAAMLEDVLAAVGEARSIESTILVSGDPLAQEIASGAATVVPDPADEGHVEAAMAGIARAQVDGAACVVLLAGDCPLLDPRELDRLLTGVPDPYVAIVPDRHGEGTNALVLLSAGRDPPGLRRGEPSSTRRRRAAGRDPVRRRRARLVGPRSGHAGGPDRADPRARGASRLGEADGQSPGAVSAGSELRVLPVLGFPEVTEGAALGELVASRVSLLDGDVVVFSQKVVSKAEGRVLRLSSVLPSSRARRLAAVLGKDPAAGRADTRGEP